MLKLVLFDWYIMYSRMC